MAFSLLRLPIRSIQACRGELSALLDSSKSAKMPNILQKLPAELLSAIFDLLAPTSADVHAVRLACRAFESAAWPAFARTFDHKVFHIMSASLDALLALARHEEARSYIRELNLSTVGLRDDDSPLGAVMGDGDTLRRSLAEAVRSLKGLTTITVVDGSEL